MAQHVGFFGGLALPSRARKGWPALACLGSSLVEMVMLSLLHKVLKNERALTKDVVQKKKMEGNGWHSKALKLPTPPAKVISKQRGELCCGARNALVIRLGRLRRNILNNLAHPFIPSACDKLALGPAPSPSSEPGNE